jgi:hypothetical protein
MTRRFATLQIFGNVWFGYAKCSKGVADLLARRFGIDRDPNAVMVFQKSTTHVVISLEDLIRNFHLGFFRDPAIVSFLEVFNQCPIANVPDMIKASSSSTEQYIEASRSANLGAFANKRV